MALQELPIASLMLSGGLAAWPLLRTQSLVRAAVSWVLSLAIAITLVGPTPGPLSGCLITLATTALLVSVDRTWRRNPVPARHQRWTSIAAATGLGVALPLLILGQHEAFLTQQTAELLQAGRIGEAARTARARWRWYGDSPLPQTIVQAASGFQQPLNRWSELVTLLEHEVLELQSMVETLSKESADGADLLQRCRLLAVLGQRTDARHLLEPLQNHPAFAPEAELLGGLLDQADERWIDSQRHFNQAAIRLSELPAGAPNREVLLKQARLGQAFAARKLGRFADAEQALLGSVSSPVSAADHFLLAQFYEDAQRTDLAAEHARRAQELDPRRYQASAAALIDRLATSHLGCWSLP